jgi:hypothetical protein
MDILKELAKEHCPKHEKNAQCKLTPEGIEIKTCCKDFRETLLLKLKKLNGVPN